MRDEVFCRLCLLLQDTLLLCVMSTRSYDANWHATLLAPVTRKHTKKDANYVIKLALISNPYLYIIFCNLLAHMNLEIKSN
jgi:hypothetical protein